MSPNAASSLPSRTSARWSMTKPHAGMPLGDAADFGQQPRHRHHRRQAVHARPPATASRPRASVNSSRAPAPRRRHADAEHARLLAPAVERVRVGRLAERRPAHHRELVGMRRAAASARSLRSPSQEAARSPRGRPRPRPSRASRSSSKNGAAGARDARCPGGHGRSGVSAAQICTCASTIIMRVLSRSPFRHGRVAPCARPRLSRRRGHGSIATARRGGAHDRQHHRRYRDPDLRRSVRAGDDQRGRGRASGRRSCGTRSRSPGCR